MSEPISAGDLVMVMRVCCDQSVLGVPFLVMTISDGTGTCGTCGKPNGPTRVGATGLKNYCVPLPWLKRIPPLGELEGEKQKEDLREPA